MRPTLAALPIGALLLATALPADVSWTPVEDMVFARAEHAAAPLPGGRVLVLGGIGDDIRTGEIWEGRWRPTSPAAESRLEPTATPLRDGRVLVTDADGREQTPEIYDSETGRVVADRADASRSHAAPTR